MLCGSNMRSPEESGSDFSTINARRRACPRLTVKALEEMRVPFRFEQLKTKSCKTRGRLSSEKNLVEKDVRSYAQVKTGDSINWTSLSI